MNLLKELRDRELDYQECKKPILEMMNQVREEAIERTCQLEDCSREEVPNILILNTDHENLYDKYLALSFAIDYHDRQIDAGTEEIVQMYLENVNFNGESNKVKNYLEKYISNPEKINPDFNGLHSPGINAITFKSLQYKILPYGNRPNVWAVFPLVLHLQKLSQDEEHFNATIRHEYTHRFLDREVSDLPELKREKPYTKAIDESAAQAVSIIMIGKALNSDYYKNRHHESRALLETCTQAFVEYAQDKDKPVDAIRRKALEVLEKIQSGESARPEEMILGRSMDEDFEQEKRLRAEIERIEYYFKDSVQILGLSEKEEELWESKRGRMGEDVIGMTEFLQEENSDLAELIAEEYSKRHKYFKIAADLESKLEGLENFFKKEDEEREKIKELVRELEKAKHGINEDFSSRSVKENLEDYITIFEKSGEIAEKLENMATKALKEMEAAEVELKKLTETELFQGRGFDEMDGDIEFNIYRMVGMLDGAKEDIEGFIEDYERIRELVERSEETIEKLK